ncbi:hypothetical protein [Acidovorax sp. BLS4]|uniref:hypothetical protein n=1 Tax=Acidovorax sp. BLS4 TaxID=3273430 RepID=UPI002941EABC|nr:hypothetical protein [Paracidovorax avenae]WOI44618.1 hypothetical protein R1Z03_19125 [Paracidovorax avenae]
MGFSEGCLGAWGFALFTVSGAIEKWLESTRIGIPLFVFHVRNPMPAVLSQWVNTHCESKRQSFAQLDKSSGLKRFLFLKIPDPVLLVDLNFFGGFCCGFSF